MPATTEVPCTDKSTKFLATIGYNVVSYPSQDLKPLQILGRRITKDDHNVWTPPVKPDTATLLGPIAKFFNNASSNALPTVIANETAADVDGKKTDNVLIGAGFQILGTFIKAMGGGDLGASEQYTQAKGLTFSYTNVLMDRIEVVDLGSYLTNNKLNTDNPVISEFSRDEAADPKSLKPGTSGELLVITNIIKTDQFSVKFLNERGNDSKVDFPAIKGIISGGGHVNVDKVNDYEIHVQGTAKLTFGFQCYQLISKADGTVDVRYVAPGDAETFLAGAQASGPVILKGGSLVNVFRTPTSA